MVEFDITVNGEERTPQWVVARMKRENIVLYDPMSKYSSRSPYYVVSCIEYLNMFTDLRIKYSAKGDFPEVEQDPDVIY